MRLRQIQKILSEQLPDMNLSYAQIPNTNPARYKVEHLSSIRDAINKIQGTGLFPSEISNLRSSAMYGISSDEIQVNGNEVTQLNSGLVELKKLVSALVESLEIASIREFQEESLSIKLPKIKDFDELKDVSDKLKKAITIPIDESNQGKVEIANFDTGSFWIDVLVGSSIAVTIVGSIVWAGAVIFKKIQEAKIFEQYANGLKAKNEHIQGIVGLAQNEIDLVIEAEADHIYFEHFEESDNKAEKIERLKLSIKSMSDLISKGTEVHASLTASEDVKNLFPSYSALNLIESKIKQIENK